MSFLDCVVMHSRRKDTRKMPSRKAKKAGMDRDLRRLGGSTRHFPALGILAQGMDMRILFESALLQGQSKGPLQRAATDRFGGRGRTLAVRAFGRKEPEGIAVGFP